MKNVKAIARATGPQDRKTAQLADNIMLKVHSFFGSFSSLQYTSSYWLQVNRKCGGVNFVVRREQFTEQFFKGTMFVGADVMHPPPLSRKEIENGMVPTEPSIAGVGSFSS